MAAIYNYLERLQNIEHEIIERPVLAPYFYAAAAPPDEGELRVQVETLARGVADCLEYGLSINELLPGVLSADSFKQHALDLHQSSPVLRLLVDGHPSWWPSLERLWRTDALGTRAQL